MAIHLLPAVAQRERAARDRSSVVRINREGSIRDARARVNSRMNVGTKLDARVSARRDCEERNAKDRRAAARKSLSLDHSREIGFSQLAASKTPELYFLPACCGPSGSSPSATSIEYRLGIFEALH